ncbi:MAG: lipopolysaccharide assembly protein LapB [Castellaniella sp.]|uniref:lipopolysaccharide assembly protein LapB n=1 Tax=Castellaniella sp. TaxID=1955812 RepID=UPI0012014CE8|nr:lipopolysaccharide assembly protein LapB [Castellaniella sp.]TAN30926.1 MAG: lipopolysaccharide assembly protein LapB [Castellaniella sp.]
MNFEPWWLIIVPVLFGLGWVAARFDFRQMLSESRNLPDSYFKGLNFLLNEEPDRAIDAFIEVAKLDPETTELHFALGSLFRRRGEVERAIRVHQSLLQREDLPLADRENAQLELAQDFFKAGLLDRAEHGFQAVLHTRHALDALRALIRIYESEHDWPRAIEAVQQLRGRIDEPVPQLAHYHCERALVCLAAQPADPDGAAQALEAAENAIRQNGGSPASETRVRMLRAQWCGLRGDVEGQCAHLRDVLTTAPEYAGLVADALLQCHQALGRGEEGLALLRAHYAQTPTLDLFNAIFRALRTSSGSKPAWAFARDALRAHPSLLGLDRLLEVELSHAADGAPTGDALVPDADLGLLRSMIHKHSQRLDRYACSQCGFEARRYYWQCPGCNAWETYRPRRLEEIR